MKAVIIIIIVILLVGGGYYLYKSSHATAMPTPTTQTAMQSGSHQGSRPSGSPRGHLGNMPAGSKPIFGDVTAVNSNTLTVQMQSRKGSGTTTTLTVDLTSSTQYTGGSQSTIKNGTRIAGYGTANSNGSITAEKLTINPTFPTRGTPSSNGY